MYESFRADGAKSAPAIFDRHQQQQGYHYQTDGQEEFVRVDDDNYGNLYNVEPVEGDSAAGADQQLYTVRHNTMTTQQFSADFGCTV